MSGAGGKGHAPRPYSVDAETYSSNWDAIFGARQKDQAVADAMRAENLARAITNTEQDAKDG